MTNQEIFKLCEDKSIRELENLIYALNDLRREKYNKAYVEILIYPGNMIVDKIIKETGYDCYHLPSENTAGRGTHVIVIPREVYTEELKERLVKEYDDN